MCFFIEDDSQVFTPPFLISRMRPFLSYVAFSNKDSFAFKLSPYTLKISYESTLPVSGISLGTSFCAKSPHESGKRKRSRREVGLTTNGKAKVDFLAVRRLNLAGEALRLLRWWLQSWKCPFGTPVSNIEKCTI